MLLLSLGQGAAPLLLPDSTLPVCCAVPQETFGAMAKSEKVAYILEQVRLCLERKDYVRAQVGGGSWAGCSSVGGVEDAGLCLQRKDFVQAQLVC